MVSWSVKKSERMQMHTCIAVHASCHRGGEPFLQFCE